MQTAPPVLSLLLILLINSGWTNGLCNLENGTIARCHELGDVKYIETYDLESLRTSVADRVLGPNLFGNLSSLRHLDLSGGDLERVEPGTFRKLINLRSLDLADNRITYLDLASVDGLNHLHSLNLRKNNLRQLPPALARLKVLRHLDIQGNPLECNCATLRVRDLIMKRGVKVSKKVLCSGPNNMKGTPLLKPDAGIICAFEEQDREMQRDQGYEGSGDEGSGDIFDDLDDNDEEYKEVGDNLEEVTKEGEIETPHPEVVASTTSATETKLAVEESTSTFTEATSTVVTDSIEKAISEDEELFFDTDDRKEQTSTVESQERTVKYKDLLFSPVEGSGDEEEGSGEGSGTGMLFPDWPETEESVDEKGGETTSTGESLLDLFFNVFSWTTTPAPEEKKEPDLEEEQFIDISSTKGVDEKIIVPKKTILDETIPSTTEQTTKLDAPEPTNGVELVDEQLHDTSKLDKVKLDEETINDELAEVSPARQSKKGMGSYVVLAALLAILATLIGFAAYKGDFCRKRRKRDDVENGTEMKDMQKALLDTGNSTQPKIASNGNVENVPLVEGTPEPEETRESNNHITTVEVPKTLNGTSDHSEPVKPPRRATSQDEQRVDDKPRQDSNSLRDDSLSGRTNSMDPVANNGSATRLPEPNGPPLSPGAQRVKITLQENPDSVPRTPILITRTLAGENLVKTP